MEKFISEKKCIIFLRDFIKIFIKDYKTYLQLEIIDFVSLFEPAMKNPCIFVKKYVNSQRK